MSPPEVQGYSELHQLARGGFGVIYRAHQDRLDRVVALKVLAVGDLTERDLARFDRECRATAALSWHPNVVAVLDSGVTDDGHPYLAMEFLEAGSLADRLRTGPLPWAEVVDTGIQVAGALGAAHAAGTLHRDLKPENLLYGPFGEVRLGDFGIAAVEGKGGTTTGLATYTVAHVAPEILQGHHPDERSDVYGLASTLHTLLTGAAPYAGGEGEPIAAVITRVLQLPPPRVEGVPEALADLLLQTLAKDPDERPQTAASFGERLQVVQAGVGLPVTPLRLAPVQPGRPTGAATADPTPTTFVSPRTAALDPDTPTRPQGEPTVVTGGAAVATTPDPPLYPAPPVGLGARATGEASPPTIPTPVVAASPLPDPPPGGPPSADPPPAAPITPPAPPAAPRTPGARRGRGVLAAVLLGLVALALVAVVVGLVTRDGGDDGGAEGAGLAPVATEIGVDPNPTGIAADDTAVWVAHSATDGTVSRLDPESDTVAATVSTSTEPRGVAVGAGAVWVAGVTDGSLLRIDPATDGVVATVDIGGVPRNVAATDEAVWVTDNSGGRVVRVDPATNTVVAEVAVGVEPFKVAATDDMVWVTNNADDTVTRIDPATNEVVATVAVGRAPQVVLIADGSVWVSNVDDGTVSRVDPGTNQVVSTTTIGAEASGLAFEAGALWVAVTGEGTVVALDPDREEVVATVATGDRPTGMTSGAGAIWVTNTSSGTVTRIDPNG